MRMIGSPSARQRAARLALAALALLAAPLAAKAQSALDTTPAKVLFGEVKVPDPARTQSFGSYARGCLAGAQELPVTGPTWQAMRLSRNRNWGTAQLVDFIERLSQSAHRLDGWNGLLVGDMGQPRGGPALTGHASHQIGLDTDIWLRPMPDRMLSLAERETFPPISMVNEKARIINASAWTTGQFRLVRRAALDPEVARIFVNPAIKKQLCEQAGGDRGWLNKVRPWWGHTYHMHVRLSCPAGEASCVGQKPPPPGDGCGAELDSWLRPPPPVKPGKPTKPPVKPRPVLLADLPAPCRQVLTTMPGGLGSSATTGMAMPVRAAAPRGDAQDGAPDGPVPPASIGGD